MYVAVKNKKKDIADGVHLVLAQDGEKWVNYLEQYSLEVEQLMKLTPSKRRFYEQGMRAATLPTVYLLDLFVTPPDEALQDGSPPRQGLMREYLSHIPDSAVVVLAGDHTAWSRPYAKTLQERTYEHQPSVLQGATSAPGA